MRSCVVASVALLVALSARADDAELRALEGHVGAVRAEVGRSRAALQALVDDAVVADERAGRIEIVHENRLGSSFVLVDAEYVLDGKVVWRSADATTGRLHVFHADVDEGPHTLVVRLVYRGNGTGLFPDLLGYTTRVEQQRTFDVAAGRTTRIAAVGYDRGSFVSELFERPGLRFDVREVGFARPRAVVAAP